MIEFINNNLSLMYFIAFSVFIGIEVISNVPSILHTPLMSGANDVVNPAAESNMNSPIYGMTNIRAHEVKRAIVLKRSMSNGYAGVQNELF